MYKLSSSDSTRTVFVSDSTTLFFQWICGFVGIALLPISLVAVVIDPSGPGAYLIGTGLVFVAAAALIGDDNRLMPHRIEFRNDEGRLLALDKAGRTASISYADILGFYAYGKRRRTGIWFSAVLKSGAVWDIAYAAGLGRWRKKDELMALLQSNVNFGAPLNVPSQPLPLPAWIQKQRSDSGVFYSWREPASLRDTLVLGALFTGFSLLLGGGLASFFGGVTTLFVVCAFAVAVLFTIGLHIYRLQNRSHVLSINDAQVVYGRPRATSLTVEEVLLSMDRNRLQLSYYSFDLAGSQRYCILFVDEESRRVLDGLRVGGVGLGDIFTFVQSYSHLFKITFIGRPVLDIVNLQQDIHRELDSGKQP